LVIGVALVMAGIFTAYSIHSQKNLMKEQAMIFELKQLRMAVEFYSKSTGQNPPDLRAALQKLQDFKNVRLTMLNVETGEPKDPFGTPYRYVPSAGWVRSGTAGYEGW
ncbi:MAG: hypothetical protein Q7S68_00115, partial [Deltaproteobacteria bacterium]|nr:hypothetical protein [Deltaproteobacteria bacterium]